MFAHALSHDAYARLSRIRCPVALACGAQTDGFGPDVLEAFLPRLAASTLVVSPGIGHFGPLEDPAEVAVSVQDCLVPVSGTPEA